MLRDWISLVQVARYVSALVSKHFECLLYKFHECFLLFIALISASDIIFLGNPDSEKITLYASIGLLADKRSVPLMTQTLL